MKSNKYIEYIKQNKVVLALVAAFFIGAILGGQIPKNKQKFIITVSKKGLTKDLVQGFNLKWELETQSKM
jgi:hypothetical protein